MHNQISLFLLVHKKEQGKWGEERYEQDVIYLYNESGGEIIAYTPQVQELCDKKATQNEVERMLDWLLMYAGDERMLKLYKQVCRTYWKIYPESIAFYIMEYRKEYDRESLIGTEYEYLLHEDEMDEK